MRYYPFFTIKIMLLSFAALTVMISIVSGSAFYVDSGHQGASDDNPGSELRPWKTIQKAADTVQAGDFVYVKSGVYHERVSLTRSGTSTNPITFKSYVKHGAVIDGSNSVKIIVNWKGNGTRHDWIVLDGFVIRNSARCGVWVEGDHNTLQNCMIHDNGLPGHPGHTGLQCTKTDYVRVIGNEVHHSGWNGISLGTSTNGTVEYNDVHDNKHHNGINIMPSNTNLQVPYQNNNVRFNRTYRNNEGIYMRWQQNNEISNNVVFDNIKNGIEIMYYTGAGASTYRANIKIYNNTIAKNGSHGIRNVSGTHLKIKNNIFYANTKDDINFASAVTTGHSIDYNLYYQSVNISWGSKSYSSLSAWISGTGNDRNSIEGDPAFVKLSAVNCAIGLSSKAIDKGVDLTPENIASDIKGNIRPQGKGFDIGAFEFRSSQNGCDTDQNLQGPH